MNWMRSRHDVRDSHPRVAATRTSRSAIRARWEAGNPEVRTGRGFLIHRSVGRGNPSAVRRDGESSAPHTTFETCNERRSIECNDTQCKTVIALFCTEIALQTHCRAAYRRTVRTV